MNYMNPDGLPDPMQDHEGLLNVIRTAKRFICPGCGEKATAKKWAVYCPECDAYVHHNCRAWCDKCPLCGTYIPM